MTLFVVKRDGREEEVQFDKITARIEKLCYGLDDKYIDANIVAQKVVNGIYPGVTTVELDSLASETAAYMSVEHPDYALLAARIAVSNLHKQTEESFAAVADLLHSYVEPRSGLSAPLLSDEVHAFIKANADALQEAIDYSRDFTYDFFGFKTLERSYLLKVNGAIAERPQHMLMRVACGIHCGDLAAAVETYDLLSDKWFTHASPTLFNAGTPRPQLSSCFLVAMKEDSIEGIYSTLGECAQISKSAGGIGLHVSNIRATGSYIRGTNGTSNGLTPMLRVFNDTARYVDQGGGKRKGAIAVYLEPWHADVFEFLELKKNHGKEENRARDLFYGLWVPDLFMRRVESDGEWSLMCPVECPGLQDAHGAEFDALYERYEREGKARRSVPARELWSAITNAQMETGVPYMLFKDAANAKSNQKNLGTIKCSNLCTEIIEYTSADETAVCNLASLNLSRFVVDGAFDHARLAEVTRVATRNLNRVIDINWYPTESTRRSNLRHRPIGLGVQGLADVFCKLRLPFESDEAYRLNAEIFETIYYSAVKTSMEIARDSGKPYSSFKGSPASEGKLQFDLWADWGIGPSGRYDWDALKADVVANGMANSLLLAPMPTASTAQILGNNEATEPFTSNIYSRRTLAGEFTVINKHLLTDLIELGIWSSDLRNKIIANGGSVQKIDEIPADVQALYKTVWEIKQKRVIEMAAERGRYVCQSQSLNIHIANPTPAVMSSLHFFTWKSGLKTGQYYLRTKPAADALQFTVDKEKLKNKTASPADAEDDIAKAKADNKVVPEVSGPVCTMEEGCWSCGS